MHAIYIEKNLPKIMAVKLLGKVWPSVYWAPFSPVVVGDLPEPSLPGRRWLKVKNHQCGICASDLTLLRVSIDPSVAQAALPGNQRIYLGHEVVSTVTETGVEVTRIKTGDRVIMDTRIMGSNCKSKEIEPPCPFCQRGDFQLCENASSDTSPSGTGGGWSDGYTAHETEVYVVPDDISDDQATLIEPMSVALHAVLRRPPQRGEKVLVVGCGLIGLLAVQAIRAVCPDCHLCAMARHPYQAKMAGRFGADEIIPSSGGYEAVASLTGAKYYAAPLNKGMLLGGFDVVYDCVGTETTIENSLRWARAGGAVVMVGISMTRFKIDLNPLWYQEVTLTGTSSHSMEQWPDRPRHTYDLVIDCLREGKLTGDDLITHRFPLKDYKQAVAVAMNKSGSRSIKVIFDYSMD